ncbi:hypothetical protein HPP92_015666 [Vanilla planifolia]|uniref:Aminoacyl-tRNA synthetase class Ia domain-containing protein n=1 Tax=Vanilla planifolia TaxID=51239 RepID=A0A835QIG8_VANPL|nr:hypothetical protein HPP92_015666 [Vanilla planifolia]
MVATVHAFLYSLSPRPPWASYRRRHLSLGKTSSLSLLLHSCPYCTELREIFSMESKRSAVPVMATRKSSKGSKQETGKYKHTIDLPKTTFGLRANSVVREPEIQKLWDDNQCFKRAVDSNTGGTFVLHDGPPYANGKLHMGHALNKILKDIINRYKKPLQGMQLMKSDPRLV